MASEIFDFAPTSPQAAALRVPSGNNFRSVTFEQLEAEIAARAVLFIEKGLRPGHRALVFAPLGLPLLGAVFALMRIGAVPVIMDPGMGRKALLGCIERTQPDALVGVWRAQIARWIFRDAFHSVRLNVWLPMEPTEAMKPLASPWLPEFAGEKEDLAAILFTSGSTGAPKGVCYEYGMLESQLRSLREDFGIKPGDVDLPLLSVFALFNPALGVTTVIPPIDPREPAALNAAKVVAAIQSERVTNSFGAPPLWRLLARYADQNDLKLETLRRIFIAGAPVHPEIFSIVRKVAPNAVITSPYGATEALPVAAICAEEVLAAPNTVEKVEAAHPPVRVVTSKNARIDLPLARGVCEDQPTGALTLQGAGTCVGRPLPQADVRIISIHEGPLSEVEPVILRGECEVGEIIVRGPMVSQAYNLSPEATAAAKIFEADGSVWHRMGDAGYIDALGRLWFCGRIAERVETRLGTLHTDFIEPIFAQHRRVAKVAFLGIGDRTSGNQVPVLAVEPRRDEMPVGFEMMRGFATEISRFGDYLPHTWQVRQFFFVEKFPVDVRHNAKIHRLRLARELAGQTGIELDLR